MTETQTLEQDVLDVHEVNKVEEINSFDFSSLLKSTSKILFTPEYDGNKFHPLVQKFSLESKERETQRIAMGITYNDFVHLCAKRFYVGITGDVNAPVDVDDIPITEEDKTDKDKVTMSKLKALITSDTSVYDVNVLNSMRSKVVDTQGLYQQFYESKLAFKRKFIYSKAYSMIKHRLGDRNPGNLNFKSFLDQHTIPYPLVFIIAMFYDSEEQMEQVQKFDIKMLESIDITDA